MRLVEKYSHLLAGGRSRASIRNAVSRGVLSNPSRGVYGPPDSDSLQALFVRLPPGSVLGLHSAARLHGILVPPDERVHVIVPPDVDVPAIRGVAAHASVVPVRDVVMRAGVPCAPAYRCAVDLARRLRRLDALSCLDSALSDEVCTTEELTAEVALHDGLRGVRQARELIDWADPRPECPQESHLRLVLLDGRLPPPEPQVWVDNGYGTPMYRLDLGYRERRIGIEYDGSSHLDVSRMTNDRYRHNWLVAHGWRIRYFTARDLYRNPHSIVATVSALLADR